MRFKHELTLIVAGVTLCTLTLSFALVGLLEHRDDIADLDSALAKQAAKAVARGMDREGVPSPEEGWVDIPEMVDVVRRHAALYDVNGRLLRTTSNFQGNAPDFADLGLVLPLPPDGVHLDMTTRQGQRLRSIVMQVPGTNHVLLYAASSGAIDHDARALYGTLGSILLFATGLVVVMARWLGERLSREVGTIAQVARDVAQGDLRARIGTLFTSTELKNLASDLNHMVDQLETAMHGQQRFIAYAAHELRSPLTTLRGELQLALMHPRSADAYHQTLDRVLLDVESLVALSEDLLTLVRARAERHTEQVAELTEILGGAVSLTQRKAEQAQVQVAVAPLPRSRICVRGQTSELTRALRNLIDNAIAHSTPQSQVRVDCQVQKRLVQVSVADEGPGIHPEDAERIFEPFFRASTAQAQEGGAGLGLSIAREIVQRSEGTLNLETHVTHGACFVVTLPIVS